MNPRVNSGLCFLKSVDWMSTLNMQLANSWNGIESGSIVKVPDGRTGRIKMYRLYNEGPKAPGRCSVQFFDVETNSFFEEGYNVLDISALCPCCGGTGRVLNES
jgi:hypothetical protein